MSVLQVPFLDLNAGYQELKNELDIAYQQVMDSGWYILGQENNRFETAFAEYCRQLHCVGTSNGLDALSLILQASGIGPGDEVIVPAHTFIATWLAVSHCGATPIPVDVSEADYNLNPSLIEGAITNRTRAIMPVHLYGYAAEMNDICAIARRHELIVIEDAAQAHGTKYRGSMAGSLGDAAAFSFYPGKNLGAFGDGGAVVTNQSALFEQIRLLRNYGSRIKYQHESIGYNARLDELQAAFLTEKLKMLDIWNQRRKKIASQYLQAFADIDTLVLPPTSEHIDPSWHLFVVRHQARDQFRDRLANKGIETLIHYPVTPFDAIAYKHLSIDKTKFPVARQIAETVISLPIGPHMTAEQTEAVIAHVRDAA